MAESDQHVSPETLAKLPSFAHARPSPAGDELALYYDETGRNELYLLDRETGDYRQVSDANVPKETRWHLAWGADGERVFYHRDEDGDEQNDIWAIDRDGAAEPVVEIDGQAILSDTSSDALLFASDAGQQLNLYRHDLDADETVQLTHFDQPARGGVFDPDGDRIAFVSNETAVLENRDVYVMAADGSDRRRLDLGASGSEAGVSGWLPDGDRVLVSDNADDLRRAGIYDLSTDEVRWLGPHEAEEMPVDVSPDGETVLAIRTRRGAFVPVVYDVETGEGRELDVPEGVTMPPRGGADVFVDEETLVFGQSRPDERKALYEYDLATDEMRTLLPADYGDVDPDRFVDAEYVTYDSEDGTEIGALLYDPREGPARPDDATDVPAVVVVHGGPHSISAKRFNLYTQFLVSQGYAVFEPNYRGSVGRGREFKQAILGDWGGKEQADVAAGGRWLMARDWVDEDRVAVYGGSYGGYSVYSQLTRYPDLWTTGIASVGITDLHKLYEEDMAHFQHMLRQQMGDPEENHDLWRERSPIEHVDAMERPIYIIHGVNDPRCPITQARIFRDALEERGWQEGEDYEYTELHGEGHGSSDIDNKVRKFELLSDYLDRRL